MSKYCPKCKMNFSDEFDECVYCGEDLKDGIIETEDTVSEKSISELSDTEILEKYSDYRKRIEIDRRENRYYFVREAKRSNKNN